MIAHCLKVYAVSYEYIVKRNEEDGKVLGAKTSLEATITNKKQIPIWGEIHKFFNFKMVMRTNDI
jgi:hypothetical protein